MLFFWQGVRDWVNDRPMEVLARITPKMPNTLNYNAEQPCTFSITNRKDSHIPCYEEASYRLCSDLQPAVNDNRYRSILCEAGRRLS